MLLFRTSKGISLVEVVIAIFLTTTAVFAIFALQAPAWKTMAKADHLGRASEIMHRQLESTEVYLLNQCNTSASNRIRNSCHTGCRRICERFLFCLHKRT